MVIVMLRSGTSVQQAGNANAHYASSGQHRTPQLPCRGQSGAAGHVVQGRSAARRDRGTTAATSLDPETDKSAGCGCRRIFVHGHQSAGSAEPHLHCGGYR